MGTDSRQNDGRVAPVLMRPSGFATVQVGGQSISLSEGEEITFARRKGQAVDLCFVFDTTGSMNDKIDGLVQCLAGLVDQLARLRLDWRLTVVPFGDLTVPGDRVVGDLPFVSEAERATRMLCTLPRFSGGGNQGESSLEAMLTALDKPYRPEAVKVVVLLTDESALVVPQLTPDRVQARLRQAKVVCFVASPPEPYFRSWAQANAGAWYPISASMETAALLELLRSLVRHVADTAGRVHQLAGGSVARYLQLTAPKERP